MRWANVTLVDDLSPISAALVAYDDVVAHENGNGVQGMHDITAGKAKRTVNQRGVRKSSEENLALHLCYGQIGISAVAAAVRYQGHAKNLAYAPATTRAEDRGTPAV